MNKQKKFDDIRKPLEENGFEVIKVIGKGAFGEVILCKEIKTGRYLAVKTISKTHIKRKPFLKKYIEQEIDIMRKLQHPNIVRQDSSFETSDFIIITMEYCELGNLLTYQSRLEGKTFRLSHALQVIVEIMKGLKCIHQRNFIHRDIKSQNVLLTKETKKDGGYDIRYKIADFGFARSIGGVGAKTHCGTEKYMAPEIINNSYYGISVDIWALGILFFFMLFAQYPFKSSHDMKTEIYRRCNPYFSVTNVVSKKDKLKEVNTDVEDFFRKIFVIDSKRRITFASMIKHPLFAEYRQEFEQNIIFYSQMQEKEQYQKDLVDQQYAITTTEMAPQDESRSILIKKKRVGERSQHLQRELEEIYFEIRKVLYLQECAVELYENYSSYLTYAERLAARFYLLKAFLFYVDPLLRSLKMRRMPECLYDANISSHKWQQCIQTEQFLAYVNILNEEQLKCEFMFDDTYSLIQDVKSYMPIKNFDQGYTHTVNQKTFEELKFSYRSTTSYIFKSIHENKDIDLHLRDKIKMRLFCCHMINRIFTRNQIKINFPHFIIWLQNNNIKYPHTFDFVYFKKWVLEETQENLEKNILILHKKFF